MLNVHLEKEYWKLFQVNNGDFILLFILDIIFQGAFEVASFTPLWL